MLLGGVITTAHFAARNPESLAGRAVLTAGRIAIGTSPVSVLSSTITHLEKSQPACEEAPVGGEEHAEPAERSEPLGAIVIPDNEPVALHPEIGQAFDHLVRVGHDDAVEILVGDSPECPLTMPLCDQEGCEKLGMPCSEGDFEEQEEAGTGSTGAVEKLFRLFEKSVKKTGAGEIDPVMPATKKPECREDAHRHDHHSGCPYTGHGSMYCPVGSYNHPTPATTPAPLTQPGAEETNEPTKPEQHSSALGAIRRFTTRGVEDTDPAHAEIDTMEYRIEDGQLYDFGPGAM